LIIRSLARCCQEEGYHLIVEPCGFSHEEFMMRLKALLALQVGAVVMIPPCSLHADLNVVMAEHRQKQSMFKNIFCADWFHQQLVFDCVEPDEQLMVELPLRHFHEKGHRYIGVIGDGTLPRRHSLAKVLDDLGMADTKELAMKGFVVKSDRSLCDDDVPELVRSMFHGKVKPTALYCWRDSFAAVAYRICEQEFGLRVGRDIALIGQDDTQLAQLLPTPITSLNHCDELLASQLFELIMDRLNGKLSATIQRKRIQSRLVVRQSTDYVVA
jgi:LacI family transcriptional regulator